MNIIAAWLLTVAVHGVVLLLAAWMIDIWVASLRGTWRELLWRSALFGCVLTATLQVVSQHSPLGGRWNVIARIRACSSSDRDTGAAIRQNRFCRAIADRGRDQSSCAASDCKRRRNFC